MSLLELQVSLGLLIASFTILAIRGGAKDMWKRKTQVAELQEDAKAIERVQRIRNAQLAKGQVKVNTRGVPRNVGRGLNGFFFFIANGSYGQNMVVRILNLLYLCGLEQLVGWVFLIQHNAGERDDFPQRVAAVYHDRMSFGYSPQWAGGFANKAVAYVMAHKDEWAPELRRAADEAAYRYEQRNRRVPGQIIFCWSEGGQAPVAAPPLEVLCQHFPRSQVVGMTSLPKERRNRQKYAQLKPVYDQWADGWLVSDRLHSDWRNADFCIAALLVASSDAQLYNDDTTQFNNTLALAFTENPGSVLTLHYISDDVVAYPWEVEGELLGYWVDEQRVVETVQRSLRAIEEGKSTQSLTFPIGEPNTAIYDIVMVSVGYDEHHQRDDMQSIADRVEAGYHERLAHLEQNGGRDHEAGMLYGLADHDLKFGSLATIIRPERPSCPVLAVRLGAIKGGAQLDKTLARVPEHLLLPHERTVNRLLNGVSQNGKEQTIKEQEHIDGDESRTTDSGNQGTRRGRSRKPGNHTNPAG